MGNIHTILTSPGLVVYVDRMSDDNVWASKQAAIIELTVDQNGAHPGDEPWPIMRLRLQSDDPTEVTLRDSKFELIGDFDLEALYQVVKRMREIARVTYPDNKARIKKIRRQLGDWPEKDHGKNL